MSRPLPLCAWCGNPLAGEKERILVRYSGIKGAPEIGWHGRCLDADELAGKAISCDKQELTPEKVLAVIIERASPGRPEQRWRVVSRMVTGDNGMAGYYWGGGLRR